MDIQTLDAVTPSMFSPNHTNDARWLSVHIQDMNNFHKTHPAIESEFHHGHFMVHKTENVFSDISADQAHEQNHQCIKSDGGAIVLTKYAAAL